MSTITAIRDALVSIIGAASAIGSANVGYTSYNVLDTTTTGYAVIVRPASIEQVAESYGRFDTSLITCRCEGFVKHHGDDATYMAKQWIMVDDVLAELFAHDDLDSTCANSICTRVEIRPQEWSIAGNVWQQIDFIVQATVYGR